MLTKINNGLKQYVEHLKMTTTTDLNLENKLNNENEFENRMPLTSLIMKYLKINNILRLCNLLKGTVRLISSDPPCKYGNARFN